MDLVYEILYLVGASLWDWTLKIGQKFLQKTQVVGQTAQVRMVMHPLRVLKLTTVHKTWTIHSTQKADDI